VINDRGRGDRGLPGQATTKQEQLTNCRVEDSVRSSASPRGLCDRGDGLCGRAGESGSRLLNSSRVNTASHSLQPPHPHSSGMWSYKPRGI